MNEYQHMQNRCNGSLTFNQTFLKRNSTLTP